MGEQSAHLKDNGNGNSDEQENHENDGENMSDEEMEDLNDITPEGKVLFNYFLL